MATKKLNGTVIVTYRCNARCTMCNRYKAPSKPEEEISLETIRKLPPMYFTNITGGEPFIRTDLKDIVRELRKKSDRIVISTNGFFTDRILDLCKEFPDIGIRISIEGLEQTNNEIRGLADGYNRGYTTLKKLREMGMKDVGFGMTVQDKNAPTSSPSTACRMRWGWNSPPPPCTTASTSWRPRTSSTTAPWWRRTSRPSSTSCCGAIRPKSGSAPTSTMASSTTSTARSVCCPVI